MFSSEFCKISKNTFFTEHLRTTASEIRLNFTQINVNYFVEIEMNQFAFVAKKYQIK